MRRLLLAFVILTAVGGEAVSYNTLTPAIARAEGGPAATAADRETARQEGKSGSPIIAILSLGWRFSPLS